MYGINFYNDEISYKYCVEEAIECIASLMEAEYKSHFYYENMLKDSQDDSTKEIVESILDDERNHIEILRKIYLDLTGKNHLCDLKPFIGTQEFRSSVMWSLLDKFKVVKKYNSILESFVNEHHKASIIKIANDELVHISQLNFILMNLG